MSDDNKTPSCSGGAKPSSGPPIDPWEARERERARYSRPSERPARSSRPSRSSRSNRDDDAIVFNVGSYLAAGIVGAVAALVIGESPFVPAELRSMLTVGGSVIVILLLASARSYADNLLVALRRGPNAFLLGLVLWSVVAYFISPFRSVTAFGASELLRVLAGAGLYFLAAYGLRSPKEVANVVVGLISLAVLVALADFLQMGQTKGMLSGVRDRNLFGTHENLGALMLLVLPISFVFALSNQIEEKRRVAALAATLILLASLMLTRARSAWIGTTFALALASLLWLQFGPKSRARKSSDATHGNRGSRRVANGLVGVLTSPATLIGIGVVVLIAISGTSNILRNRASVRNALTDSDVSQRIVVWKAASRMTTDRVWTGWGLGSYWLIQGRWTHLGDDVAEVIRGGAYQDNNAHDYYVQWAADTGAPGLFLYVATVTGFLIAAGYADRKIRQQHLEKPSQMRPTIPPFQQLLVLGSQAAVVGAMIDSIASPAYIFHGISAVFWLIMGLGVAAMRPAVMVEKPLEDNDAPAPVPALGAISPIWGIASVIPALAVVGGVLYVGYHQTALGKQVPRGVLSISAKASGPLVPGQLLSWRAVFHDEKGNEVSTCPGTLWEFNAADRKTLELTKAGFLRESTHDGLLCYSDLQVILPATTQPITAHAFYYDTYGRRYDAWSEIDVLTPAAAKKLQKRSPSTSHQ